MTFKEWYYLHASNEEKKECAALAGRTAGMPEDRRVRERTLYKLGKLCLGRGLTVVADISAHCMRWRVADAPANEPMQFDTAESAVAFCREEAKTVADHLGTIIPLRLVMPDGKAVLL